MDRLQSFCITILSLIILLLATRGGLAAPECPPSSTGERGVRGLIAQYQSAPFDNRFAERVDRVLALPYVQGVSLYLPWRMFESAQGEFNWAFFDSMIASATRYRKVVALGLQTAAVSPDWVKARTQNISLDYILSAVGRRNQPIPWDPYYIQTLTQAIRAIGARYDGNPTIAFVNINGPSPLYGLEVNWPMVPNSLSASDVANLGFTLDKFVQNWNRMTDMFLSALPNTPLSIALNNHISIGGYSQPQVEAASIAIRNYALSQQMSVQPCRPFTVRLLGLNAGTGMRNQFRGPYEGSQSLTQYTALAWDVRQRAQLGYEAARVFSRNSAHGTSAYSPEQMYQMMEIGASHDANFVELKIPDILDPRSGKAYAPYAAALQAGDATLTGVR